MTDNHAERMDSSPDSSLSRKVVKGALWVTAATICARSLNVISAIILARLLAPEDFGLMAIAIAIVALSQGTTHTGFESALIQKQDRPEDFLNSAWTFELIRYLVLFLIIFFAAPLFASFFNDSKAVAILRVISLTLVFQGLRNVGVIYFKKNLDFHKQFVLDVVPLACNIGVVIPLAFYLKNVWALVCASVTTSVVACFISYIMHPYRPRLDFSITRAGNLFGFGKWILGLSLVGMIRDQGMPMFVGKFLGIPMLGFFNRAGAFSTTIFQQISEIVWKVGYPTYSQLQRNPNRFKQAYLETLTLLTFIGIPLAGGVLVLSRDFVHLFLTDKWLPIVPVMQILSLRAMLRFINTPANIAFQASGRPAIGTKISMLGAIILIIIVYPLSSRWGISGVALSLFLSVLIPCPIAWYMTVKIIKCSFGEFIKSVLISTINMIVMVIFIFIIKEYVLRQINIPEFSLLILAGIIIYYIATYFVDRHVNYGIYSLVRTRIRFFRNEL